MYTSTVHKYLFYSIIVHYKAICFVFQQIKQCAESVIVYARFINIVTRV